MKRHAALLLAFVLGCSSFILACSGDETDGAATSAGGGGGGSTTSTSSASSSSSTSATTSGGGGAGGEAPLMCPDPANPAFGSCIEGFLAGCYEPDLTGTCTEEDGVIAWEDGSKYVTEGDMPGLYGPGDAAPCITVTFVDNLITATKGAETLTYASDQATETAVVTCPDGSTFTIAFPQITAFNRCTGVNCP